MPRHDVANLVEDALLRLRRRRGYSASRASRKRLADLRQQLIGS